MVGLAEVSPPPAPMMSTTTCGCDEVVAAAICGAHHRGQGAANLSAGLADDGGGGRSLTSGPWGGGEPSIGKSTKGASKCQAGRVTGPGPAGELAATPRGGRHEDRNFKESREL